MRQETRRQRYLKKASIAKTMPVSVATINFMHEANLAYVIRAAACFGAEEVCVIGSVPDRKIMNELSGTTFDYVKISQFSNVEAFLAYIMASNINLLTFDLPTDMVPSVPMHEYEFDFTQKTCIVVGHETIGIPVEISINSDCVYIPMPGHGYCLNTSQACNIGLYEAATRYANFNKT